MNTAQASRDFNLQAHALVIPGNPTWNQFVNGAVNVLTNSQVASGPQGQGVMRNLAALWAQDPSGQQLPSQLLNAVMQGLASAGAPQSQIAALETQIQSWGQQRYGGSSSRQQPSAQAPLVRHRHNGLSGGAARAARDFNLQAHALVIPGNPTWNQFVNGAVNVLTNSQVASGPQGEGVMKNLAALWAQDPSGQQLPSQLLNAVMQGLASAGAPQSQISALETQIQSWGQQRYGVGASMNADPQVLVNAADNHFQQKAVNIAKCIMAGGNAKCTKELYNLKTLAEKGDWSSRQVLGYISQALANMGANSPTIQQATMTGEDITNEVASVIRRADRGDQNAMAMLESIRANAAKGNPLALRAFSVGMEIAKSYDTSFQGDVDSTMQGEFGASHSRKKSRAHKPSAHHKKIHHMANMQAHRFRDGGPSDTSGDESGSDSSGDEYASDFGATSPKRKAAHHVVHHSPQHIVHHRHSHQNNGSNGGSSHGVTPLDKLIAAAEAGDVSAQTELDKMMHAEQQGDQRAASLMHAVRAKTVNSHKGKQARAAGLSHGKPLTSKRVAKMAGDFGAEYGPEAINVFYNGLKNPGMPIPSHTPGDIANVFSTGQAAAMAQRLQAARVPGASLSLLSPQMGWEMGELSNLHATMGDEGQYNAAEAGDPYFAQQQLAVGDTRQINVNQVAFRQKLAQRNNLAHQLDALNDQIAHLRGQLPSRHEFQLVISVSPEWGAEGQYNAAEAGDPYFAQQQVAAGQTKEIHVNQDAFRLLVNDVQRIIGAINTAQATLANLQAQQLTGVISAPPVVSRIAVHISNPEGAALYSMES